MAVDDRIIERIQKLLRLANNDAASEGEIENAMAFARKLMDEYDIAEHSIILEESDEKLSTRVADEVLYATRKIALPRVRDLAQAAANVCDCRLYYSQNMVREAWRHTIRIYGLEHDVAVAHAMFKELCVSMRALARMLYGTKRTSEHCGYEQGFADRVLTRSYRIADERRPEEVDGDPSTCTAIVLRKDVALDRYRDSLRLKPMKGLQGSRATAGSAGAYDRGWDDGGKASLDSNQIAGGGKRKKRARIGA